jgi:hypothetical protein
MHGDFHMLPFSIQKDSDFLRVSVFARALRCDTSGFLTGSVSVLAVVKSYLPPARGLAGVHGEHGESVNGYYIPGESESRGGSGTIFIKRPSGRPG